MKLSIVDRIVILKALLPETGNRECIKLIRSIKTKLGFSSEELESFNIFEPYKGMLEVPIVTSAMLDRNNDYDLISEEIDQLRLFAQAYDNNGWVTDSSLETIDMLIDFKSE